MQLTYMFVTLLGVIIGGGSITLASNPSSRETKNGMSHVSHLLHRDLIYCYCNILPFRSNRYTGQVINHLRSTSTAHQVSSLVEATKNQFSRRAWLMQTLQVMSVRRLIQASVE